MRNVSTLFTMIPLVLILGCATTPAEIAETTPAEEFVHSHQTELVQEMKQGNGEKLRTLATLTGCDSEESQQAFITMTKDSYDKIVSGTNTSSQEMVNNLRTQMFENDDVALLCDTAAL